MSDSSEGPSSIVLASFGPSFNPTDGEKKMDMGERKAQTLPSCVVREGGVFVLSSACIFSLQRKEEYDVKERYSQLLRCVQMSEAVGSGDPQKFGKLFNKHTKKQTPKNLPFFPGCLRTLTQI